MILHADYSAMADASVIEARLMIASMLGPNASVPAGSDDHDDRRIWKALALLSEAQAICESLNAEQRHAEAGWKWLCLATKLKAVMDVVNQVREESPAFRERVYRKWVRLCEARPDPVVYWHFIDVERDRCATLDRSPLRWVAKRRRRIWVVDGGMFEGYATDDLSAKAIKWLAQYVADLHAQ
ncbi:hypothetical protein EV148_11413 [Dokdonella fugitiva]|jgi:hypothetical protein|uniref:Uncharacterized protein n=2 Tax=Dokdonella fugitiva TaxID=328517 RepID=A0A4R2HXA3_9GAMM|nr:hypothetical protein EV148_11413 [Dokdonella fugitiva]